MLGKIGRKQFCNNVKSVIIHLTPSENSYDNGETVSASFNTIDDQVM